MFPGRVEHAGDPITKGKRYIIVLFMGYDSNRMTGRDDGYVLDRYVEQGGQDVVRRGGLDGPAKTGAQVKDEV